MLNGAQVKFGRRSIKHQVADVSQNNESPDKSALGDVGDCNRQKRRLPKFTLVVKNDIIKYLARMLCYGAKSAISKVAKPEVKCNHIIKVTPSGSVCV